MKRFYLFLFLAFLGQQSMAQCTNLFFSEYVEGSSSNKAIEIYNPTSSAIDLTNYVIYRYNNGSQTATDSLFPQGMLAANDVFIIGNPSAASGISSVADTTHSLTFYNGDDAIAMIDTTMNDTLDIIGVIGVDPGTNWTVGSGATSEFTLVRMPSIQQGETNWTVGATQWIVRPQNTFDSLNAHTMMPCSSGPGCTDDLFFSEYVEGSSSNKALEIYNPMDTVVDLTAYVIYRYNNGSTTATDSLFPQGMLGSDSVYVIGNPGAISGITNVSDTTHTMTFYNGDDAIALINRQNNDTLDIIGIIGVDPGTNWSVGTGATSEFTLVRMPSVQQGETNWTIGATQWIVRPQNTVDSLGFHNMDPCTGGQTNPPVLAFSPTTATVTEANTSVTVTVTIANATNDTTKVDVSLNAGNTTATNGSDFAFTSPVTLTFPPMSTTPQTLSVTINDDAIVEGDEDIQLELTNATNNAQISGGPYTLTIQDNDVPTYPISTVNTEDANGVADSSNVRCRIVGTVYGVDLRGGTGIQFTLIDNSGGIGVFSFNDVSSYVVNEGDSIAIIGTIGQFNGLTQIDPDSITFFSSNNTLKTPNQVTQLSEATESDLVKLINMRIITPSQWTGSGSGFNVDITNGTDTLVMRIDNEVDLYSQPVPAGPFDLCGIGGQFDNSNPFTSGYQILPRYQQDIKLIPEVMLGNDTSLCQGQSLTLTAGTDTSYTYAWSTGATTASITVSMAGTYSVTVTNPAGPTTGSDTIVIGLDSLPVAGFTVLDGSFFVTFTDTSKNATSWSWAFGDGNTSGMQNPTHTYSNLGTYNVTLIASNACGSDTATGVANVISGIFKPATASFNATVWPNPGNGAFNLELDGIQPGTCTLVIHSLSGKQLWEKQLIAGSDRITTKLNLEGLAAGYYLLKVETVNGVKSLPVILE